MSDIETKMVTVVVEVQLGSCQNPNCPQGGNEIHPLHPDDIRSAIGQMLHPMAERVVSVQIVDNTETN